MKKRFTSLAPKVKTKVKLSHKLRYAAIAGAFALGVFSVALVYNTLGTSHDSIANNKFNGMETLAEYKFRKTLSIDPDQLPSSGLSDFPLMVSLIDDDLRSASNGGKVVSEKGNDIRFTKSDGISLLDYEIEKYNPKTGELLAWVRIDSLTQKQAAFFLYFSNKFASDESSQNAWNKTYKGVWHLKGALSSKTPHSNQLTQQPAAKIEMGKEVYVAAEKNSSQFPCLNSPEDIDITGDITVSAWVMLNDKKEQTILSNQSGFNGGYRLSVSKDKKLEFEIRTENSAPTSIAGEIGGLELEKGKWYHVAAVYSDGGDSMATYINGKHDRSIKTELSLGGSTEALQIGREPNRKIYYFGGLVDEVHVSNIIRSSNWIAAEFASQAGSTFIKFGATEEIQQQISMSLLTFEAEVSGQEVELKWLTAMEIDNDEFVVERSTDGLTFAPIGTKPGAGNSNELLSYRFKDLKPAVGTNYYRVKLRDTHGVEEFSMVTPVNVEAIGNTVINIGTPLPNPFVNMFEVQYSVPQTGKALVKLRSVQGDVILQEEVNCEGLKPQRFLFKDDKGMRPGVYFFTVGQEEETKMVKLIKRI
jgi:hypothetical protein